MMGSSNLSGSRNRHAVQCRSAHPDDEGVIMQLRKRVFPLHFVDEIFWISAQAVEDGACKQPQSIDPDLNQASFAADLGIGMQHMVKP